MNTCQAGDGKGHCAFHGTKRTFWNIPLGEFNQAQPKIRACARQLHSVLNEDILGIIRSCSKIRETLNNINDAQGSFTPSHSIAKHNARISSQIQILEDELGIFGIIFESYNQNVAAFSGNKDACQVMRIVVDSMLMDQLNNSVNSLVGTMDIARDMIAAYGEAEAAASNPTCIVVDSYLLSLALRSSGAPLSNLTWQIEALGTQEKFDLLGGGSLTLVLHPPKGRAAEQGLKIPPATVVKFIPGRIKSPTGIGTVSPVQYIPLSDILAPDEVTGKVKPGRLWRN